MDSDSPDKPKTDGDVALIHGRTPDGEGLKVIRRRADRIELADVRPLKEGKPITGEVVRMTPRPDFPLLCDVKTEMEAPSAAAPDTRRRSGPAQVATDDYRRNWDAIFQHPSEPPDPELMN